MGNVTSNATKANSQHVNEIKMINKRRGLLEIKPGGW